MNDLILKEILSVSMAILTLMSGLTGTPKTMMLGADANLPAGLATYNLSGAGISSSATSMTLASLTIPQTGQQLIDADFSDTFYITLEPGSRKYQEFVSCTTVSSNTLSGCSRGLSPISPYTASTSLAFAHAGGTQVIFSNSPQFYNNFTAKNNDETITGTWSFPTPTGSTEPATKGYVDSGILAGAATATESVTGISRLATALQTASSTATTANTPLVLQAQNATSTYNSATAPLKLVVTDNSGKIDGNFIDTTEVYAFSGANTHAGAETFSTATSTFNATTSISASTGSALRLNGVNYTMPSSDGASTTVLMTNGSGGLTWEYPQWELLYSTTTTYATQGATTTTFSARKDLMVLVDVKTKNTSSDTRLFFNGDYGANYGYRLSTNNAAAETANYISGIKMHDDTASTTTHTIHLNNISSGSVKIGHWFAIAGAVAGVPTSTDGAFVWNNTSAAITSLSVVFTSASQTMGIGSRIAIYGLRD